MTLKEYYTVAGKSKIKTQVVTETMPVNLQTKEEILAAQALDYAMTNQRVKLLQARMKNVLRPEVESELAKHGVEDISGHKHLVLPNGVEVIHERRAPIVFNQSIAATILAKKGILDYCSTVVTQTIVEEEKVLSAYEEGLISPQEFAIMFSETVSWALKVNVDGEKNPEYTLLEKMRKQEEANKPEAPMPEVTSS